MVASSSSVYGATPTLPKREDLPTRPMSPYAASKLATESYTNAYFHSFGLDTLALRFFNVFGPRQPAGHAYAAVVPAFVDAALAGRPLSDLRRRHAEPRLHVRRHRDERARRRRACVGSPTRSR